MNYEDYLKSGWSGLLQGVTTPTDLVASMQTYPLRKAYNYFSGNQQASPESSSIPQKILDEFKDFTGGFQPNKAVASNFGGSYQPQTKAGEYIQSVGTMVPSVAMGPGGWFGKAGVAIGSGVGGQAGSDLAGVVSGDDPSAQMAGRFVGSLIGGGVPAAINNGFNRSNRVLVDNLSNEQLAKLNVLSRNKGYLDRIIPQLEKRDQDVIDQIDDTLKPYLNKQAQYATSKESILQSGQNPVDLTPVRDYLNNWIKTRKAGQSTTSINEARGLLGALKGKDGNALALDDLRDQLGANLQTSSAPVRNAYQMIKNQIDAARPGYKDLLSQGRQAISVNDLADEFKGALQRGYSDSDHLTNFNSKIATLSSNLAKDNQILPKPLQDVLDQMKDYTRVLKGRGGSTDNIVRRAFLNAENNSPLGIADFSKLGVAGRLVDKVLFGNYRRWNNITNPAPNAFPEPFKEIGGLAGLQSYNANQNPQMSGFEKYLNNLPTTTNVQSKTTPVQSFEDYLDRLK